MAPLKVIGAGVSRSGTNSLKSALNILGYKTHHMREMLQRDLNPGLFIEAYNNPEKPVDWSELYGDYDAGVECPTFCFIDRLVEYFPDAKVILTKRDPDDWYKSVLNTICKYENQISNDEHQDYAVLNEKLFRTVWLDGILLDWKKFHEQAELAKDRYEAHNKHVMETVPAERLLVLDLREGITWDKLCAFLEKPVPSEPFPFLMTTKEFVEQDIPKMLEIMKKKEDQASNNKSALSDDSAVGLSSAP
ncbi:P-loop containing nucleoside triphosphate hydrolase protein [Phascolomyces articulosus]|uniref:P-loop containing nucleoside triphosphate hydrolase protein n=1 Tax=Phascolomyces articulosus TaxID=60185 RepID=A0AAD5PDN2_9FUNG|nr:P-loop containing nucleoside triphosphate hydrolase protein [Phascolomyces articulosus]